MENELSTRESRDLVDQCTALKIFQVNVGGGEPFVREDFLDLLSYSHEKGLVTCVSTNGGQIVKALAGRLSKLNAVPSGEPGRCDRGGE